VSHERDRRGRILLAIARRAIADPLGPAGWARRDEAWLAQPAASFVTLRQEGDLRGCIGSIEAFRALADDVHENARAAAFRDPRFPPVAAAEIARLEVEVSVLSAREPMEVASEEQALDALRPGIDGLVLEFEGRRATFLPQVWEGLPEPASFLSELRRKASLPPGFWHPGLRLSRYTVEKYR